MTDDEIDEATTRFRRDSAMTALEEFAKMVTPLMTELDKVVNTHADTRTLLRVTTDEDDEEARIRAGAAFYEKLCKVRDFFDEHRQEILSDPTLDSPGRRLVDEMKRVTTRLLTDVFGAEEANIDPNTVDVWAEQRHTRGDNVG